MEFNDTELKLLNDALSMLYSETCSAAEEPAIMALWGRIDAEIQHRTEMVRDR